MKSRFVAVSFLVAIIFSACLKEHNHLTTKDSNTLRAANTNRVFASAWEPIENWSFSTSGNKFSFTKPLENGITGKGTVLVFVRNIWDEDLMLEEPGETEEPLMMPFNFLPFTKKPTYVEEWNYTTTNNKLDVELKVASDEAPAAINKKLELQYIFIPQELLAQKGQSEETLRLLSYKELIQTFSLSS